MTLQSVKQRFGIIGRSEQLDRALTTAIRVANTDLTVLIQGKSGVGKEVFSKIIHSLSSRKHNTFIAINCGAIPEGTINSELFGHEKGAFTGASTDRKGYFETADKGTIFLDEIGEMPMDTQAYLLRVLESGEFLRVGSSKVQKTDVRVIAATNVDLLDRVKKGKFREDLYYRLSIVPIRVPSLQERPEDIYMLFRKFAVDFAEKYRTDSIQLDPEARRVIESYNWPGNIRELKNVVEQLSILSENKMIGVDQLLQIVPTITQRNLPSVSPMKDSSDSLEEREILYKLLFEMKSDLTDLKKLVWGLIQSNDLSVPNTNNSQIPPIANPSPTVPAWEPDYERTDDSLSKGYSYENDSTQSPIIISPKNTTEYHNSEEVDESLSIESMEKELIKKALKKYRNRRKEAAKELGISERTLYRKIKQYEIA